MTDFTISLPETQAAFIDEQVAKGGFENSSQFLSQLIGLEQDRQNLRSTLLAGGQSPLTAPADAAYFASLRERAAAKIITAE